jgi:hypothetical protein
MFAPDADGAPTGDHLPFHAREIAGDIGLIKCPLAAVLLKRTSRVPENA